MIKHLGRTDTSARLALEGALRCRVRSELELQGHGIRQVEPGAPAGVSRNQAWNFQVHPAWINPAGFAGECRSSAC